MDDNATAAPSWRRNVALFLVGQTVSLFGSMVVQYVVMWWVTLETRSGLAVALYAVAAFLPQGLVSLFGGVLADRMNRRVLVMVADAGIAAATLVLALLMANGVTDLWIVLLAVAVRSVGAGFQTPAVQAMIPQVVPGEHLMRVNGIFQTIHSAMALLAPAAAGAIFAAFGIVPVFFLDVVTAVIGIGLLALVAVPTLERVTESDATYWQDLAEGMRYIRTHPIVRWLLIVYTVIFLLTVAPSFVTPLMVARDFGSEEWMLAVLEIAFSLGMLLGGVLMSTVLAGRGRVGLILVAVYGFGAVTLALGLSTNLWVFYGFMFLLGLLVPPFSTPFVTLIQETVEATMHGRVFSYVSIVMALATPVGMVVFGPLADVVSVQALLIVAGLATIVVMAIATRLPSGRATMAASKAPAATGL
ncbi:MFS transporter, DHA3 family, macrolide efflux protein [Nonomuraea solani]|uniref:MFS transporter, DHA3 family, macrolide efflux protein n=1 Tax=Nonomuraea solani TaxID=1144553 RepID=A0A1H5WHL5_9ACTN|nr:MFS transporter [Nonomuraea solani]SEF98731.1 MFS transporter, DHA3 family, macrolide efflux protein [Nonomuraea solani]